MKRTAKTFLAFSLIITFILTSARYQKAGAYTPSCTTLKIGLYYGSNTLASANLQNVSGYGSGFQFGILDANRQFTPIGAVTTETKISVLRDKNMIFDSGGNKYDLGTTGSVVVGCYHIQLDNTYSTYNEALAAVSSYQSGFVKYSSGVYRACIGNYISAEDTNAAISANGITGCSVNCGTSNTVTVVKTGTNNILFEFEYGSAYFLVVMPVSPDGTKCQTWFKSHKYYGGFQYARIGGENITVINVIDVEDYTKGVIQNEMVGGAPLEAYKAQAVCARTYAIANLNKHKSDGFDLCTTEDCQVYDGLDGSTEVTNAAVDQTMGRYLTYNGQLCVTFYSSSDGGGTENSENVWVATIPYLRGVIDPYEADIASIASGYNWTVTYTPEELTARLRAKNYNIGTVVSLVVSEYTKTGNVYKVTLIDSNGVSRSFTKGDTIRSVLGLKSIHFTINGGTSSDIYVNDASGKISGGLQSAYAVGGSGLSEILGQSNVYAITGTGETVAVGVDPQSPAAPGVFVIKGTGRGHSVGMSQWGAYSMAKFHGMTYDQILQFYFTGAIVE
jgi:stage II sporulation protein D